ncbi:hypothetical protein NDU88_005072 [Pleurodeles waltl]|uniref:Uncharacterized protein n=1 Tax=Pleurodeles waltl TaxID=8319 RepID=A0AAV7M877_PLEWA|nr:hypothetical protein NDU88_005072 [Pleurodeles waltl]
MSSPSGRKYACRALQAGNARLELQDARDMSVRVEFKISLCACKSVPRTDRSCTPKNDPRMPPGAQRLQHRLE